MASEAETERLSGFELKGTTQDRLFVEWIGGILVAKHSQQVRTQPSMTEVALRLLELQSSDVQESLQKLEKQYGGYAVSAHEIRDMLDKALGDRTLTEELYRLRGA